MTDAEKERAAVVAWLRAKSDASQSFILQVHLYALAEQLERGDHLEGKGG